MFVTLVSAERRTRAGGGVVDVRNVTCASDDGTRSGCTTTHAETSNRCRASMFCVCVSVRAFDTGTSVGTVRRLHPSGAGQADPGHILASRQQPTFRWVCCRGEAYAWPYDLYVSE